MAGLIDWRMLNLLGSVPNGLDAQSQRVQKFGLIELAQKNKDLLLFGLTKEQLEDSKFWGAPANKIPVRDALAGSVSLTPMTCTFPTNESTVNFVTATFLSAHFGFKMNKRLIAQNGVNLDYEKEFAYKVDRTERKLAAALELQIYTALNAAKATTTSSALVGVGNRYGALVGSAIQISAALRPTFFNDSDSIFLADNFDAMDFDVIGDAQLASIVNYYGAQGGANNTNTAFQFPNKKFSFSNTVATTASALSTGFIMPPGSLGFYSRLAPEHEQGLELKSGIEYGKYASPMLGIDLAVLYKDSCGDESAVTENARDTSAPQDFWQMGYTVCILTPSLATGETNNGIKKFDFLNV